VILCLTSAPRPKAIAVIFPAIGPHTGSDCEAYATVLTGIVVLIAMRLGIGMNINMEPPNGIPASPGLGITITMKKWQAIVIRVITMLMRIITSLFTESPVSPV
jgi:hypothetical protein